MPTHQERDKQVALVTGANQGIGLQIAKDLASHGFSVLAGSRDFKRGEDAAKFIKGDAHALHEFGRLDVRINNAAVSNISNHSGTETVEERAAVRVALLGPDRPAGTFNHAKLGTIPW